MAETKSTAHQAEATFRNYSSSDAANYAAYRPPYPPIFIQKVIDQHSSTGGQLARVLDIGCGPGTATRQVAAFFQYVIGVDAGESMIETARQTPCLSSTGEQATFEICGAEEIDKLIDHGSIDLITVAMAAHWFDMPRFYAAASKVLKPSGSIAIWTNASAYVDPKTTPNAAAVQSLWSQLEFEILDPFMTYGNRLVRGLYKDLPLPWTVPSNSVAPDIHHALTTFDQHLSSRKEFNRDGIPDPAPEYAATNGFVRFDRVPFNAAAKQLGTASAVTRWRAHHKEALEKGEIEDCVAQMLRRTKETLAEVEEGKGRDWVDIASSMVVLIIKKKAESTRLS